MFGRTRQMCLVFLCIFCSLIATGTGTASHHTKQKGRKHPHEHATDLSGRAAVVAAAQGDVAIDADLVIEGNAATNATNTRIINGTNAARNEFPYQLLLLNRNTLKCGAVLISADWALTAAHCMDSPIESYKIVAGKLDRISIEAGQQVVVLSYVAIHPNYTATQHGNDIALLRLSKRLPFGVSINPIRLADTNYQPQGRFTVSGWGKAVKRAPSWRFLQKAVIPNVDIHKCADIYKRTLGNPIYDTQVCAGDPNIGYTNACFGDSGGPLAVTNGNKNDWFLVGIVSYGAGCERQDIPVVYTRVSSFRDWIAYYTGIN